MVLASTEAEASQTFRMVVAANGAISLGEKV